MGVLARLFDTRGRREVYPPVYGPATEEARRVGKRTFIVMYPERPYPTEPVVCPKCAGVCSGPRYVGLRPEYYFYDPMDERDLEFTGESERLQWTCACGAIVETKCADTEPSITETRKEHPAKLYVGGGVR